MSMEFRPHGYSGAPGGRRWHLNAIELVRTHEPDVVLLNIVMPDVNGFEVLDWVRKFSQVPVIVFTGRSEIAQFALTLGANDPIIEPLDPTTVCNEAVCALLF